MECHPERREGSRNSFQANTGMLRFLQHDLDAPNYDAYFSYKTVANLARKVFRIGLASVILQKEKAAASAFSGQTQRPG
jgi:hypothetical protein